MLVLTRKKGQQVIITTPSGEELVITVTEGAKYLTPWIKPLMKWRIMV